MVHPSCRFFFGCGYHARSLDQQSKTPVYVPYVEGDVEGIFTSELIEAVQGSPRFVYTPTQCHYQMTVRLLPTTYAQVGYKQETEKNQPLHRLIVVEGRTLVEAEVSVMDQRSNRVAFGPKRIQLFIDYDFVDPDSFKDLAVISPSGEVTGVTPFSLGQLGGMDTAQDSSRPYLYKQLAQKVIEVVSTQW